MQLLNMGIKDERVAARCDDALVTALVFTVLECIVCVASAFTSCKMAKMKKGEIERRKEVSDASQVGTQRGDFLGSDTKIIMNMVI